MIEAKIDEKIFDNNIVTLFGVIDDEMTERVLKQLLALQIKFREECIVNPTVIVLINSPGGIVTGGMAMHDVLKAMKCKVITVCVGLAASMGATLLATGTKGYRYALGNSEIMIHQPLGGTSGQATDIELAATHIVKIKRKLNEILSKTTGQTLKQVGKDTERDFYMSPIEAKKYGLIDKIIDDFSEVYNEISYK